MQQQQHHTNRPRRHDSGGNGNGGAHAAMTLTAAAAASPIANSVVQPRFQKPLTVTNLASMIARKNPRNQKLAAAFTAQLKQQPPQVGVTFFPPMTLNPTIVAPAASKRKLQLTATAQALPPPYFNWGDAANVAAAKNWGLRDVAALGPYILPPPNQLSCGSCWAVAAASVLSDRWAIFTQGPNPRLSATNTIGCVSNGQTVAKPDVNFQNIDGCNGGMPAGAAELFATVGIVDNSCIPYDWCDDNGVCRGSAPAPSNDPGTYLNTQVLPACTHARQCITCTAGGKCTAGASAAKVYKAKRYTPGAITYSTSNPNLPRVKAPEHGGGGGGKFTVPQISDASSAAISLTNITDIKNEIFANGPVVGAMAVFADFQSGSSGLGDDWAPTSNVYINVQGPGAKPYDGTAYGGVEGELTGYHAVTIVGWGVEKGVRDWEHAGQTIDVPYWIVRNSWSDKWNKNCTVNDGKLHMPGFFKIGMTNAAKRINTQVYLDGSDRGALGGATAFEPDVVRAPPPAPGSGGGGGGGGSAPSPQKPPAKKTDWRNVFRKKKKTRAMMAAAARPNVIYIKGDGGGDDNNASSSSSTTTTGSIVFVSVSFTVLVLFAVLCLLYATKTIK